MLQGCGSGIGSNDGAADRKDTLGAPSTAVPTDLNSLMAGTGAELVGEPEFRLMKAADVELPDGVEQLEDVAQADTAFAEKAASLVRINNVNPARYRCTVTQNFTVANFYEPYHTKVASVMRAKNNVVTGAQMNTIIYTHFRNGLAQHVGGAAAGYLYGNNVNSQTRYTGYQRGSGAQASRSLFASEVSFNTSDTSLCQAETSSRLTAVNGVLTPFWAAMVAGVSGSILFGVTVVGILSVAPELVGGGDTGSLGHRGVHERTGHGRDLRSGGEGRKLRLANLGDCVCRLCCRHPSAVCSSGQMGVDLRSVDNEFGCWNTRRGHLLLGLRAEHCRHRA
jgi:hypothetical protein